MKVYPIYHSGFLVELEKHILLFDYWQKPLPLIDTNKPIYVFISHDHHDHYDPKVKEVVKDFKYKRFIADEEITDPDFIKVKANEKITVDDLKITTLRSTDKGVAFIVEVEEKRIYHAGDLHLWLWDDDTKEIAQQMSRAYLKEMIKIKDRKFDLAFLVLDSRQSDDVAYKAIEMFDQLTETKYIFPMHFTDDLDLMEKRLLKLKTSAKIINTRRIENYEI